MTTEQLAGNIFCQQKVLVILIFSIKKKQIILEALVV